MTRQSSIIITALLALAATTGWACDEEPAPAAEPTPVTDPDEPAGRCGEKTPHQQRFPLTWPRCM